MKSLLLNTSKSNNRIKSGITGFDRLVNGGFRPNTVNVVLGDTGTGKSSFSWHFIGFDDSPVIYMSLEEDLNQIRQEAKSLGIDTIEHKIKKKQLHFIAAFSEISVESTSGEIAKSFFDVELPQRLDEFKKFSENYNGLKIIIDPLTPLLFEVEELKHQRETINRIFRTLRSIGTTVITLEKGFGEQLVKIPLFLADSVIDIDFLGLGSIYNRTLTVRKFRGSSHSEKPIPVLFEKGVGLKVLSE
ncbi:MAG: RAD55 family ATPase [Candidatus Hodarchaeales archaeon]|jgi:circadian clock protein KaiC